MFATTVLAAALVFETKSVPAQPTLVLQGEIAAQEAGEAIGAALGAVAAHLEKIGAAPTGAPFTRTFSFENGRLSFEAGFPTAKPLAGAGKIKASELPAALVVTTVHTGPQETTESAYAALHGWMKKNGKAPAGAPWELYLDDPQSTPAAKQRTAIFFPIR